MQGSSYRTHVAFELPGKTVKLVSFLPRVEQAVVQQTEMCRFVYLQFVPSIFDLATQKEYKKNML